ncbi:MAG: zf-HC2 domain-containing protein, partial [Candidatus Omnitrophica bacterium]|nr:zf-HC2 domain-containing protein [Candidatus Omnitrophota bacterium]
MIKCPQEHQINAYLQGILDTADYEEVERHIADCPYCIYRISEAYEVLNESRLKLIKEFFMTIRKKMNPWLACCIIMF